MKVVITGGSGLIGSEVARDLGSSGHDVVILTRDDPAKAKAKLPPISLQTSGPSSGTARRPRAGRR